MTAPKQKPQSETSVTQWLSAIVMLLLLFVVVSEKNHRNFLKEQELIVAEYTFTEAQKEIKKVDLYTYSDFIALSKNCFYEGRGTSYNEKVRIINVTMNRVKSKKYPETVKEVVKQHKQFSWTLDKKNTIDRVKALVNANSAEKKAWNECKVLAHLALTDQLEDKTDGSLFYHTHKVSPKWAKKMDISLQSTWHIFYKG